MNRIELRNHSALLHLARLYGTAQSAAMQLFENAVDSCVRARALIGEQYVGQVYIKVSRTGENQGRIVITDNGHGMNPVMGVLQDEVQSFIALQNSRRLGDLNRLSEADYQREYESRWNKAAPGLCSFEYMATHVAGSSKEGSSDQRGQKGIGFWSWLNFAQDVVIQSKAHSRVALPTHQLPPSPRRTDHWKLVLPSRNNIERGDLTFPDPEPVELPLKDAMGRVLNHGTTMLFTGISDDDMRSIMWRLEKQLAAAFEMTLEKGIVKITIIDSRDPQAKAQFTDVVPNKGGLSRLWVEEMYTYPATGEQLAIRIGWEDSTASSGNAVFLYVGDLKVNSIRVVPELDIPPFNHPNMVGQIQLPRSPKAKINVTSAKDALTGAGVSAWTRHIITNYSERLNTFLEAEREQLAASRLEQLKAPLQEAFNECVQAIRSLRGLQFEFSSPETGAYDPTKVRGPLTHVMAKVETRQGRNVEGAVLSLHRIILARPGKQEQRLTPVTISGQEVRIGRTGKDGRVVFGEFPLGIYEMRLENVPTEFEQATISQLSYRFTLREAQPGYQYTFFLRLENEPTRDIRPRNPREGMKESPDSPIPSIDFLNFKGREDRWIIQRQLNKIVINLSAPAIAEAANLRDGTRVGALLCKYFTSALADYMLQEGIPWDAVNRETDKFYEIFLSSMAPIAQMHLKRKGKTV